MLILLGRTHRVLRRLRRAPLFTAIALITLAVAVGANTVIFSVVNGVLLKPLSYPNPDRLIAVDHSSQQMGFKKMGISPSIYFVYREQNTTLADIGAYDDDELDVTGAGRQNTFAFSTSRMGHCHCWALARLLGACLLDKMMHPEPHKPSYSRIHTGSNGSVERHPSSAARLWRAACPGKSLEFFPKPSISSIRKTHR